MFKINRLALLVSAFFAFVVVSCKTTAQTNKASATAPKTQNEKALLWEISGKDLKKPSFLYGTIHMIPKEDFFLTDATKKNFETSARVVFEIDMKEMSNPMVLLGIMSKAMMIGGKKLSDLISTEDYGIVKNKFDSIGMPLKMFERMKPMFLSVMLGNDGEKMSLDGKTGNTTSYEMEFLRLGETQKKEFGGLETVEFQMSMFDSIPYQAQADMLVKTVKSGNSGGDEYKKMVDIYKKQDIEAMSKMLGESDESDLGQYETMLIVNRNRNWIPIMNRMMAEKPTFFAVGAGHLGGELGVVNLLRKEGYTLKAIK
ncbi:MAG: TraB/GumN family protein [Saprospiraceae bacterium]|nr:TraB/GumN family protein [Saprospiraceae bacterium]